MANEKLAVFGTIPNDDLEFVKKSMISVVPSCSSSKFISRICYPKKIHDPVDLQVESNRLSELMFMRTELAIRNFSGSYSITNEEGFQDLAENAPQSSRIEEFLRFATTSEHRIRFRRMIRRFVEAGHQVFDQAEVRVENENGVYFIYVNLTAAPFKWFFINTVSCLGIEKDPEHGLRVVYTIAGDYEDSALGPFTAFAVNVARHFTFWLDQGKRADYRTPIRHVDSKTYYETLLKVRHNEVVKDLSKKWSQFEKTDKSKHLFEDVGIVTYLAALFERMNLPKVNFVDLGCGNGVNAYLLNTVFGADIQGIGYDVKARRIWKYYEEHGQGEMLKVQPIIPVWPELEDPFPLETNFIVGIHTDELTPWIPLFAMMRRCNFFILPCCPWDFYGKFNKPKNAKLHSTWPYLDYIVSIAEKLGFEVKVDSLKIPAEKKTAIIGTIPEGKKLLIDTNQYWRMLVDQMLAPSLKANGFRKFKSRTTDEPSRNCSLPRDVMDSIAAELVTILQPYGPEGATLADIAGKMSDKMTTHLKAQNGGLQTLFKLLRAGFVTEKGRVKIRSTVFEKYQLPAKTTLPCFFDKFLDGCQHRDVCGYTHVAEMI